MVDFVVNLFAEIADSFLNFWVDHVIDKFVKEKSKMEMEKESDVCRWI